MPWFKADDKLHSHPKVTELPLEAMGIWIIAGTWCADYLTDGRITLGQIKRLGGAEELAEALVDAGMWYHDGKHYVFKDWTDYQPTKSAVDAEREAARERQRLARERREQKEKDKKASHSPVTPKSQRDTPVSHAPVTEKFECPVPEPEPVPEVPKGTSQYSAVAEEREAESFELIIPEDPGPTEDELFDKFWAEYPLKTGKKAARAKFAAALKRNIDPHTMIEAAHRYNVDPNREQAFTKHATTWLNGDHWEDPPLPPRSGGQRQTAADRKMQTARERHLRLTGQQDGAAPWTPRQIKEA